MSVGNGSSFGAVVVFGFILSLLMRLALGLEYNGAAFHGWQTQATGTGVQDVVEAALAQLAGHRVATLCAGRTDAGVHASAQVVHFDTETKRPLQAWVRGVNAHLPPSVAVQWATEVSDAFHARYSAFARRYDYWIVNAPVRPVLLHERVGWVFQPLEVEPMQQAAQALVGTHDFSAFRSSECQAKSPVRTVTQLEIARRGRFIQVRIEANAFLHHMVRNIVGALVDVGLARRPVSWLGELLASRNRSAGSATFSGAGLYLTAVRYDAHFNLPQHEEPLWPTT